MDKRFSKFDEKGERWKMISVQINSLKQNSLSKQSNLSQRNIHLHIMLCCAVQAVHFARITKQHIFSHIGYFMSS